MHAACEYGVFQFVHEVVLSSHSFVDEGIAQKQHYASALHKLVIQFLNAARYVHLQVGMCRPFLQTTITLVHAGCSFVSMLLKARQSGTLSRLCLGTVAKQGVDLMPDCPALSSIYRYYLGLYILGFRI